ncbi:hypothetical protein MPSEU_000404900 [Mayamaea pseudoterrestris]|nr:hypothetical protein MPSEU_000404900 [Mayamaea pseudoterrestris]
MLLQGPLATSRTQVKNNDLPIFLAANLSRTWKQRSFSTWKDSHSSALNTCMLVKVPKSASSTVAGMMLRLGRAFNCSVSWQHGSAREKLSNVTAKPLILLAPIRMPETRALSHVYFHKVTFHAAPSQANARSKTPGDSFVKTQLEQMPANFITDYTRINNDIELATDMGELQTVVQDIINTYDFLFVVERMDESLIVLAWILNVPVTTLLTFSSKQGDSWYLVGGANRPKCVRLVKPVLTPAVRSRLESPQWRRRNFADLLLYAAANNSLDETIDAIGRDIVAKRVEQLQEYKARLQSSCANTTHFPCSDAGQPQLELSRVACIERDFGCGYKCIEDLFDG